MFVLVMGVSGSGKNTVGGLLAESLGIRFVDSDDFHPAANIAKLTAGIALNDADREPWLRSVARAVAATMPAGGCVLACSALKERYRRLLCDGLATDMALVYLKGDRATIARRLHLRTGHFMPASLLDSQFETLEEPADAIIVDVAGSPEEIRDTVIKELALRGVKVGPRDSCGTPPQSTVSTPTVRRAAGPDGTPPADAPSATKKTSCTAR